MAVNRGYGSLYWGVLGVKKLRRKVWVSVRGRVRCLVRVGVVRVRVKGVRLPYL
jgi:hypothetical protein